VGVASLVQDLLLLAGRRGLPAFVLYFPQQLLLFGPRHHHKSISGVLIVVAACRSSPLGHRFYETSAQQFLTPPVFLVAFLGFEIHI
jgi:hypothetical protein